MILLDASVLIDYLRKRDRALGEALGSLELGVCGITRAEVIHGAKDEADRAKLVTLLDQFQQVLLPERIWDLVGQRLNELRRRGVVVPFTDVVLATLAMDLDVNLWGTDAHFRMIAQVLPLKLHESR